MSKTMTMTPERLSVIAMRTRFTWQSQENFEMFHELAKAIREEWAERDRLRGVIRHMREAEKLTAMEEWADAVAAAGQPQQTDMELYQWIANYDRATRNMTGGE